MEREEINRHTVLQYVEAFNRGDIEALIPLFTEDAVVQGVLGWGKLDIVVPIWKEIMAAFDLKLTVDSIVVEGDEVAVRYTEHGVSQGSFRGGPITGRTYEIVAMEWFEMQDGKIYRRWAARDNASQIRQMGLPFA